MESDAHYFRVGLYLVGLMLAAAFFTIWLATSGSETDEDYRIYFNESVSGLSVGSAVKYRGVNVGRVETITINKKDPRLIRVDVKIAEMTPVKTDTVAVLKLQGITGTVFIELTGGEPRARNLADVTPRGETPVIPSQASSINAIMNQLPVILDKLAGFADQMNKITSDENVARLNEAFANLTAISGDIRLILRGTKGNIIESAEQVNGAMQNLRKASRHVSTVTEQVKENPSALVFPPPEEGIPAP